MAVRCTARSRFWPFHRSTNHTLSRTAWCGCPKSSWTWNPQAVYLEIPHPLGYILWLLHSVSYLHLYHLKKDRWRFTSHVWRKITKSWLLTNRHLLGVAIAIYFYRSVNLNVASSATKQWALATDCLSPARRSTLATRKRHPGRDRVPKKRELHLAYFLGPNRRGLAAFLRETDVCKGMLLTIFCALHILIKSECGCNSSRQSEVTQSGFTGGTLVKAASGCASNYISQASWRAERDTCSKIISSAISLS